MLRVDIEGPVATLTLARPEVRNALDDTLIRQLAGSFRELPSGIRAVVLAGEGSAFCAGGDLNWMRRAANYSESENEADARLLAELFDAIEACPAVVICRVQGPAFGGGAGLVAISDIAVAGEDAMFAFSEVKLGLVPATISPFVIRKIGPGHAGALFVTGEAFRAEKALRMGLVHEVVAVDGLDEAVDKKVRAVLAAGPEAIRVCKLIVRSEPMMMKDAAAVLAAARSSDEGREGVSAFLDKRPAAFVVER